MAGFSVIIPTLNEAQTLRQCIGSVRKADPTVEIIVADGGSEDNTIQIAQEAGVIVCCAQRGRGCQCNAGAALAAGDILLFLHADTQLPPDAFVYLRNYFRDRRVQIGTFRLAFDEPHWLLNVYSKFSRFDSILTSFGDQGIVVRQSFFKQLGGFPDWPLFEDVRLLQMAREHTRVYSFPTTVTTSARRFMQGGIVRQQLRNGWYMLQYLLGVSPHRLATRYQRANRRAREELAREGGPV